MKKTLLIATIACSVGVGSPAQADAPMIHCAGTESGGSGPADYAYVVDAASFPVMEFRVGTNDLDGGNYTNARVPPGWSFAVERITASHMHGVKTPHGKVSPGPCRCLTSGSVHWWTDDPSFAVESFTFGYDHPWGSEDVGWILETRRDGPPPEFYTIREDWDAAVGMGYGPVHGPATIPEPTTFVLLAIAVVGSLCGRPRRRP